jgi:ribosome-associated protein
MIKKRLLNLRNQAETIKNISIRSLNNDKAENIVEIDLSDKADFAHFMIVATGRSAKHVTSLADKLVDELVKNGFPDINTEGKDTGDWVLIDAIDVVIHIFRAEVRENYEIEKMWDFKIKR